MGEITFTGEISTEFLCGPRRYLLVLNFLFLLAHCSTCNIVFKIAKPIFEGQETVKLFSWPLNMVCFYIEI
jgi:hypothetical protein